MRLTLADFTAVLVERLHCMLIRDAVDHHGLEEPPMAVSHLPRHVPDLTDKHAQSHL